MNFVKKNLRGLHRGAIALRLGNFGISRIRFPFPGCLGMQCMSVASSYIRLIGDVKRGAGLTSYNKNIEQNRSSQTEKICRKK